MRQLLFIPCKRFDQAKSRLAPILSSIQRGALARALYAHTLKQVGIGPGDFEPIVVTCDPDAVALARKMGFGTMTEEDPASGLNEALQAAVSRFPFQKNLRFAVIPTDLPGLTPVALAQMAGKESDWIIAPDLGMQGTNALSWPSEHPLRFSFGHQSYLAHRNQAPKNVDVKTIHSEALAFDIDVPGSFQSLATDCDAMGTVVYWERLLTTGRIMEIMNTGKPNGGIRSEDASNHPL